MSTSSNPFRRRALRSPQATTLLIVSVAALSLALLYALTLQTQISGSFDERLSAATRLKNEYIKDVGEIQVALNVWGTIHHTGYPLYAVLGNLFTAPLRLLGLDPATAASLYALAWGVVALAAFGLLLWRLTGRPILAASSTLVFGLARSIWLHTVVAEVYSMSLAISMVMLLIALWPAPWTATTSAGAPNPWSLRRRLLALALLGGIGVAHHRAVAFVAPGLLAAAWLHRRAMPLRWPRMILAALSLGLLGFTPYIYLPLRAWQEGAWVYGEPGSLRGFWIEFTGREADRLVTLPDGLAGWIDHAGDVLAILAAELTLPGLIAAGAALLLALTVSPHRVAARLIALAAAGPALFAVAFHTAVLPEAILMPVVAALVFDAALALDWLATRRVWAPLAIRVALAGWAAALAVTHYPYLHELVTEPTGQQTIARLAALPPEGETVVLYPWGPRYFAAAYATQVTGEVEGVTVVDHKADFDALLAAGAHLVTEPETFYTFPPPWPNALGDPSSWWTDRLGTLALSSAAPGFVAVQRAPVIATEPAARGEDVYPGIARRDAWLSCTGGAIDLHVVWQLTAPPASSPSIFVHLLGDPEGPPLAQADSRYPVHGTYPFTEWSPGEIVRDDFRLPRLPGAATVRFGLYEQDAAGTFVNYGETTLPVADCESALDRTS